VKGAKKPYHYISATAVGNRAFLLAVNANGRQVLPTSHDNSSERCLDCGPFCQCVPCMGAIKLAPCKHLCAPQPELFPGPALDACAVASGAREAAGDPDVLLCAAHGGDGMRAASGVTIYQEISGLWCCTVWFTFAVTCSTDIDEGSVESTICCCRFSCFHLLLTSVTTRYADYAAFLHANVWQERNPALVSRHQVITRNLVVLQRQNW
jgi:hypothetical protein